ncbi:hypothetical protein CSPX01_00394 [Colletotrichum filicis]|nr:hypothetical protein CSPX01_00394 [Colletotrichum filicis]
MLARSSLFSFQHGQYRLIFRRQASSESESAGEVGWIGRLRG